LTVQDEPRGLTRAVDLALLGIGGLGIVRLLLSIASFAVASATALRVELDAGASSTLTLWREITARGTALADIGLALALLALARSARDRTNRVMALAGAIGYVVSAVAVSQPPDTLAPGLGLAAALAPLPVGVWLLRDALRLRRNGLVTAAILLVVVSTLQLALPVIAGAIAADGGVGAPFVRLSTAWTVGQRLQDGLVAGIPLVLVIRRRAARRPADHVRELPEPGWIGAERGISAIRQALVTKALVVATMAAWAGVVGALPSLDEPQMLSITGAALAVGTFASLWGARHWLASPARTVTVWAFAAATVTALVTELAVTFIGASVAAGASYGEGLGRLAGALVALVGANGVAALLLVLALHRLALYLGVPRPARTLTRVGLLGVIALLVPWSAWIGRGLEVLFDPFALSAVLVAAVGLVADLTVLSLVMDDLERRVRRGREAAGVAARFS